MISLEHNLFPIFLPPVYFPYHIYIYIKGLQDASSIQSQLTQSCHRHVMGLWLLKAEKGRGEEKIEWGWLKDTQLQLDTAKKL